MSKRLKKLPKRSKKIPVNTPGFTTKSPRKRNRFQKKKESDSCSEEVVQTSDPSHALLKNLESASVPSRKKKRRAKNNLELEEIFATNGDHSSSNSNSEPKQTGRVPRKTRAPARSRAASSRPPAGRKQGTRSSIKLRNHKPVVIDLLDSDDELDVERVDVLTFSEVWFGTVRRTLVPCSFSRREIRMSFADESVTLKMHQISHAFWSSESPQFIALRLYQHQIDGPTEITKGYAGNRFNDPDGWVTLIAGHSPKYVRPFTVALDSLADLLSSEIDKHGEATKRNCAMWAHLRGQIPYFERQTRSKAKLHDAGPPGKSCQVLKYPPQSHGTISMVTITQEDQDRLNPGEFLNDTLIEFYCRWLFLDLLPHMGVDPHSNPRTHIFNSFFYEKYTQKSYTAVAKWTRKVSIFEQDFIIIPINENFHWFLAIICFPGKVAKLEKHLDGKKVHWDSPDESDIGKMPCILLFDSLGHAPKRTYNNLRGYLQQEWENKHPGLPPVKFQPKQIPCISMDVPQQHNASDCGLFILHYIECFLLDPYRCGVFPPLVDELSNWFDPREAKAKRGHINSLINWLVRNHSGVPPAFAERSREFIDEAIQQRSESKSLSLSVGEDDNDSRLLPVVVVDVNSDNNNSEIDVIN